MELVLLATHSLGEKQAVFVPGQEFACTVGYIHRFSPAYPTLDHRTFILGQFTPKPKHTFAMKAIYRHIVNGL